MGALTAPLYLVHQGRMEPVDWRPLFGGTCTLNCGWNRSVAENDLPYMRLYRSLAVLQIERELMAAICPVKVSKLPPAKNILLREQIKYPELEALDGGYVDKVRERLHNQAERLKAAGGMHLVPKEIARELKEIQ